MHRIVEKRLLNGESSYNGTTAQLEHRAGKVRKKEHGLKADVMR